jgi:SAM-dependent methyltransferase
VSDAGEHSARRYLKKALPLHLILKVLRREQGLMYARFAGFFPPREDWRVLDLGVDASAEDREAYTFESRYPHLHQVVAAGLEDGKALKRLFPAVTYQQVNRADGGLPFADGEFDLVFCNAVIEHVGNGAQQRAFMREILRVGRRAFITTPNRWYPVELHTMLPLLHWLPSEIYRPLYHRLGFDFFAREEHLNLLDRESLRALVPAGVDAFIAEHHFLGLPSNLLLVRQERAP